MHRLGCILFGASLFYSSASFSTSFWNLQECLDPAISQPQQTLLLNDLEALLAQGFDQVEDALFVHVYGISGSSDVVRALQKRINYILPSDIPNLVVPAESGNVARNIGVELWYYKFAHAHTQIMLGRVPLEIERPELGLIQLGRHYDVKGVGGSVPVRVAQLLHEGRHSDCAKPLSDEDISLVARDGRPQNLMCGYPHSICPIDHDYGGQFGCDELAWGAYSFSAIYLAHVFFHCTSCSSLEKEQALVLAADHYSRILPLEGMLAHTLAKSTKNIMMNLLSCYNGGLLTYLPQFMGSTLTDADLLKNQQQIAELREERMRRSDELLAPIVAIPLEEIK